MSANQRSRGGRQNSSIQSAILIAVQDPGVPDLNIRRSLHELGQLLEGLGYQVTKTVIQRSRASPSYLGEGKLREVASLTGGPGVVTRGPDTRRISRASSEDARLLVVADDELSPGQKRNLELALDVEVLDRTEVILRVFESRARTRVAKLEVDLARLAYDLPRICDDHSLGDREGGGGRASRGHTNVELAKQRVRARMAELRRELELSRRSHEVRRQARESIFRVALVGYTNAGKSALMHLLTRSDVFVEDKLFATLDTTVRKLFPPSTPEITIADTVGFISRLPHGLIASFHSTLAEARDVDLLLIVVDASDPDWRAQLAVTEQALSDIGAKGIRWILLNKIDRCDAKDRTELLTELPSASQVCALDAKDGATLRHRIIDFFSSHLVTERLSIPYEKQGALAELRTEASLSDEVYGEQIEVTVRARPEVVAKLKSKLAK